MVVTVTYRRLDCPSPCHLCQQTSRVHIGLFILPFRNVKHLRAHRIRPLEFDEDAVQIHRLSLNPFFKHAFGIKRFPRSDGRVLSAEVTHSEKSCPSSLFSSVAFEKSIGTTSEL